jgi:dCMP deaminase
MALAQVAATRSKDPITKVGCVVVENRRVLATGYNGMPRKINDDILSRYEPENKYAWFEHAERNAIYNAAYMGTALKGSTLYVTLAPCVDCARAIIQVGIARIVILKTDIPERWQASIDLAMEMVTEAEIHITYLLNNKRVLHEAVK